MLTYWEIQNEGSPPHLIMQYKLCNQPPQVGNFVASRAENQGKAALPSFMRGSLAELFAVPNDWSPFKWYFILSPILLFNFKHVFCFVSKRIQWVPSPTLARSLCFVLFYFCLFCFVSGKTRSLKFSPRLLHLLRLCQMNCRGREKRLHSNHRWVQVLGRNLRNTIVPNQNSVLCSTKGVALSPLSSMALVF